MPPFTLGTYVCMCDRMGVHVETTQSVYNGNMLFTMTTILHIMCVCVYVANAVAAFVQ